MGDFHLSAAEWLAFLEEHFEMQLHPLPLNEACQQQGSGLVQGWIRALLFAQLLTCWTIWADILTGCFDAPASFGQKLEGNYPVPVCFLSSNVHVSVISLASSYTKKLNQHQNSGQLSAPELSPFAEYILEILLGLSITSLLTGVF